MMLASSIAFFFALQRQPLAYFRLTEKKGDLTNYTLVIEGHKTDFAAESGEGQSVPNVDAHKTPRGVVFGQISQVVDGAYLMSADTGFAYTHARLKTFDGDLVSYNGEFILFMPVIDGMAPQSPGCVRGVLFSNGHTWDIGFARRAKVQKDGVVTGWYPSVNGKAYEAPMDGDTSPAPSPGENVVFKKRYFRFKNGKRIESWNPL